MDRCADSYRIHYPSFFGGEVDHQGREQVGDFMGKSLVVESLSAFYGKQQILYHVSMTMPEHQVTTIIGPSGAGKSTFVRCLNRLHETTPNARMEGSVWLDHQNLYELDPIIVRRKVGMVFQAPNPFPTRTVFENVAAGLRLNGIRNKSIISEQVEKSLQLSSLWDEVKNSLHQPVWNLTRGQQQRLCIARALAIEPSVLILDEPASTLDPLSSLKIEELVEELKSHYTIVLVTHNLQQAARVADLTALFLDGELVEQGSPAELFTRPKDKRTEDYLTGRFG